MATKLIVNCETGEVSEVELTEEELAQREADAKAAAEAEEARKAEEAAKAAKKAELLAKLGITEDDAKLLLS
jgi:membrane protein involved in colicin uptake